MRSARKLILVLELAIVLSVFGFLMFKFGQSSLARHWFGDTTVTGKAWSQNIGDIWMNCESYTESNGGTCVDKHDESELSGDEVIGFNADVHSASDVLSGWAWSSVGWVTFNKEDAAGDPYVGYERDILAFATSSDPAYPLGSPLSPGTELRGWAQASSGPIDPLPDEPPPDWTGWIVLNCKDLEEAGYAGTCEATNNFGVTWDSSSKELSGWAWGDQMIGWISFNCQDYLALPEYAGYSCVDNVTDPDTQLQDYAVVANINLPPQVQNMSVSDGEFYSDAQGSCFDPKEHQFLWEFYDADGGSSQTAFEVQVSPFDDFRNLAASANGLTAESESFNVQYPTIENTLAYNTTFYWRVKVWDTAEDGPKDSGWWYPDASSPNGALPTGPGDSFQTKEHLYPTASFTFSPEEPSQGEEINFTFTENESKDQEAARGCFINNEAEVGREGGDPTDRTACPETEENYEWDFDYDGINFNVMDTGSTATHTYEDTASHTIALRLTDQEGYTCITEADQEGGDGTQTIIPQVPLPEFRERAPSGFEKARDFTASLIDQSALDFKSIIFK